MVRFTDDLISAALATGIDEAIAAAAGASWRRGLLLLNSSRPEIRLRGYTLALDAVLRTPDAVEILVQHLCRRVDILSRLDVTRPPIPVA